MQFQSRSFAGQVFRPKVQTLVSDSQSFFAIATPWGIQSQTEKMLDVLAQNYQTFSGDKEITTIYPRLDSLSPEENSLRMSLLACNEYVFTTQNQEKEYNFGYELVCGAQHQDHILFAQIGHPAIYLARPNIPLQALGHVLDLSGGFSRVSKRLPPLPSRLVGLHSDLHCSIFSIPVKSEDKFIFISRSFVPADLLELPDQNRNLQDIANKFSAENKDFPFWLGILDLS